MLLLRVVVVVVVVVVWWAVVCQWITGPASRGGCGRAGWGGLAVVVDLASGVAVTKLAGGLVGRRGCCIGVGDGLQSID